MHSKILWRCTNGLLLLTILFVCLSKVEYARAQDAEDIQEDNEVPTAEDTTMDPEDDEANTDPIITVTSMETEAPTGSATSTFRTTTKKRRAPPNDRYGQDMVGYGNDDRDNYRDRYDDDRDDGTYYRGGRNPNRYGQDFADKDKIYVESDSMEEMLYVWLLNVDDWEQKGKNRYRGSGNYNNYNNDKYRKNKPYNDKPSRDKYSKGKGNNRNDDYDKKRDYGKKRSYQKVAFPVRHYRDVKRFPIQRFPPLFSTFPWLPIFYDKITYQTFIFSPTGGIYVLPPLINFFGKRIAVAQLIKWGYASLVSTGLPPPPGVNVAPLVQPAPPVGEPAPPKLPFNPENGRYNGGVTTNTGYYRPKAAEVVAADSLNA